MFRIGHKCGNCNSRDAVLNLNPFSSLPETERKQYSPNWCPMMSSDWRTSDATRDYGATKYHHKTLCATHQPRTPLRCKHGNVKLCHRLRQAFAERSNHVQTGGLITRTVITVHVVVFHVPLIAALRHQLPLHGDQMSPYKHKSCMNCELHLATRYLSRNTEGRPCSPQEGNTGGTTPALQPQENCVHNTSVALRAAANAQPPSSLILLLWRSRYSSDVFVW